MSDQQAILESLRRTRRRWRARLLLDGLGWLVLAVLAALVVWALLLRGGLEQPALSVVRIAFWVGLAAGIGMVLYRAFRQRADEEVVALYLEEHEPSLGQAVMSAVHALGQAAGSSPALVARLLDQAHRRLAAVDFGRRVESPKLRRASGLLTSATLGGLLLLTIGPAGLRTSARALIDSARLPEAPEPFSVAVRPGNATVPRGSAQAIEATLGGFSSDAAELVFRADSTADWDRIPMERDSLAGRFLTRLYDVVQPTEYFVESQGVSSPVYRLEVVDLPTVSQLSAQIRYPGYTGLPVETIEDATDLAVLRGSQVTVRAGTTRPAKAAYLVFQEGEPVPMELGADGRYTGRFRVSRDGFYRIELETTDGRRIPGTLDYAIDALDDGAPTVRFTAPGRDTKVTSVEELTALIEAADDFGIRSVSVHVSVNGGEERVIEVMDSTVASRPEVNASHTFFLEEWELSPGDVVAYYAKATDGAGQDASSDMYFLEVRPFDRAYREAEQQGGGGGGEGSAEGLSERQRQLVVGTFNVVRDSAGTVEREWRENVTTLAIGQGRLRQEVTGLIGRMRERLGQADSTFGMIAGELDSAVAEMTRAEEGLGTRQPGRALPFEQKALQHLQRAEAAYREVQVARGSQSGGGGGGQQSNAEDLADLFELENDRLRNQYESVQRESSNDTQQQVDETLEKLRRLASRQQQENERMARMADALRSQGGQAGGGGGAPQRDLARETEEAARRLERLARERNDPSLGETARRLREAAEAMRRAAGGGAEQGASQGSEALERLRNATRSLEQSRAEGRREEMRRLEARANELRRKQREIAEQAAALPSDPSARGERAGALGERKDALARDVAQLEADAEAMARDAARDQPKAARQVGEAASGLRENRVRDKIAFSKNLLRAGSAEYLKAFEEQIGDNLEEAAEQLGRATRALEESGDDRQTRALERARDLVRGLESLRDRARAAQDRAGDGEPSDSSGEGRLGQQGQPGQAGQQGQTGQPGQSGGQPGQTGQPGSSQSRSRGRLQSEASPGGQPAGSLSPGDARQFGREFRARRQLAESLRADLRALGEDVGDLDQFLGQFRDLDDPATFGDARGLDRLEAELIEGLKNLEFALWRKFGGTSGQQPALGASARVPPQYRELVEEYYRALARKNQSQP